VALEQEQGGTVAETTWLTQEAYDRLKTEFDYLSGPGRAELAAKIDDARSEGDLKENAGYHAAREEQAKQEARIRQLNQILRTAQVGEAPADDGLVESGMVVTAVVAGEEMVFLLGSREVAGGTELDVFSEKSPLGAAILGKSEGDVTSYQAPNGRTITVEITKAVPFTG
jgi:transcription elongation factor GreA